MSDSVWPHRRQPTRLPDPWDSPGKNTGVGCHFLLQWMKVKRESEVAQSCRTIRDTMDCSLPGSSVPGICQARVLEWGAIAFSERDANASQKIGGVVQLFRHVWLFVTPWTIACQASLSFSISYNLLTLVSIELVMSSNHLVLCCYPLLLPSIFPSLRVFSSELALHIRWPKYLSFSFSISPLN